MKRELVAMIAVALAVAAGTWIFGWWSVPLVTAIAGAMLAGRSRGAVMIASSAGVSWSALLVTDAMSGRLYTLAALLARIFPLPWPLLLLVTITYVMLMAWCAAVLGEAVRRAVKPLRAA